MLELTGYMEGELLVTFMLRLPSEYPYAMLYYLKGEWKYRNIFEEDVKKNDLSTILKSISPNENINFHILIKRNFNNEKIEFDLVSTNLS